MRIVRTVSELRSALAHSRSDGGVIGLVPTMGALHDGHLSLVRAAREDSDVVVVSLFVNPAQFDDAGDLRGYPRTEDRDAELAAAAGADLLFAPSDGEVYPDGFATTVTVGGPLTLTLEGAHRGSGHFDGVATVVTKLLNMVQPAAVYFGAKDAQQVRVVQRLVRDLDIPVRIVVCPTIREADGLALSSRNARLSRDERERALGLSRALRNAADGIASGSLRDAGAVRDAGLATLRAHGAEPEYFEAVDPQTLAPAAALDPPVLLVTAARVGGVRLIDNLTSDPAPIAPPDPAATAQPAASTI